MGKLAARLAGLAAAVSLAGCGFTPLYADKAVSTGLSSIQVVAPQGRVGFLLREELDDALAHDKGGAPAWRLDLKITENRTPYGLSLNNVAQRYEVDVTIHYNLVSLATGKIAHSGEVTSRISYDAADQPYAGIAAREDTQARAAADAARRIQIELAAWMAGQHGA